MSGRPQFEFVIYDENVNEIDRIVEACRGDTAARSRAGRLAKKHSGPVDLAYAGGADWSDRYITTASPSEFSTSGYHFERLDG